MEEEFIEPLTKDGSDLCQQLMDRYANSSAPQHRHLVATAAALRSNLNAESLPLTLPAYFAAAISELADDLAAEALDPTALSALLSFMAIGLPLVPQGGIAAPKACDAAAILVALLDREGDGKGLGMSTIRAAVKCLGVLIGFCDLENWDSIKLGFETLLKFAVDKRPKVRRCAQESLEKVFRSIHSSKVVKDASKLVLSMLKSGIALVIKLIGTRTVGDSKEDKVLKLELLEVLHVLNVVNLTAPCFSAEVIPKVLSELVKLLGAESLVLARHVLKSIDAIFEASRVQNIDLETEDIVVFLASFVSLGDRNPLDTLVYAATLLRHAMDSLYTRQSSLWFKNLPLVCTSLMGLLNLEGNTAVQASSILKDVLKHHLGPQSLTSSGDQRFDNCSQENMEGNAVNSTCAVFENAISAAAGIPTEHFVSVISVLFFELGEHSVVFMRNIVLKLAELMIQTSGGNVDNEHLQKCIGSAIFVMGVERFLEIVPITLDERSFAYSNIWLVPILKRYVTGSSLAYYMEHIVPLAKSFKKASRKVKKTRISEDLLSRAHELWGLLPSFCRHANDTHQNFASLSDVLVSFLKKQPSMHEKVFMALQVLVNENKAVLIPKKSESNCHAVCDSELEFGVQPAYSKKAATRNIKSLASCSRQLLSILSDLFITSQPEMRFSLKGAIGCLASITDSSVIKEMFLSFLDKFKFTDCEGNIEMLTSDSGVLDSKLGKMENYSKRCLILEIASCLVEGAKDDLIELIYNLAVQSFQTTDESVHCEAYNTLSKILEDHAFSSSRYTELIDLLISLKPSTDIVYLRSRYTCFHSLMVRTMKISLEEDENSKAFLILNEIILTLKDGSDEARKAAYDLLLNISSSLRDTSGVDPIEPYQKLVNMIMGYLSGSSPHIKSGAVSALSVLVYKDTNLCLSVPELVPSFLSLLQTKDVEIIKAVLGFVKVMVSSLQANELQQFLSDIITAIVPWSSVSRHHFRSKVTVIFEILLRKCSSAAVKRVTPEKYQSFLKTVLENRHGKSSETTSNGTENMREDSSAKGPNSRKPKSSDTQGITLVKHKKRKRDKKFESDLPSENEPHKSITTSNHGLRLVKRSRHSSDRNSNGGKEEGSKMFKKSRHKSLIESGVKRKVKLTNTEKDKAATHASKRVSKPETLKGKFKRNL
ncbi:uncharacterized protein LOC107474591 [Arachis duranensis]|uniref:Uncharacterized protein LOC107474591 n=1 Tax=Arachis duranensis TaxID=130453 RepID=A0A6P4CEH1_ARADU|nr:uncharacterized protein LOC107474591 [Arachis duranensis]